MGPQPSSPQTDALFINRLNELINLQHPLVRLSGLIDWAEIERAFAVSFTSGRGRPALPPRLVAGLLYLQHTFNASDEAVVNTWIENPYWQYFCGETDLQTQAPIDPSSLTRWRRRIGEEGVETLLMATIEAARRGGVVKASSVACVIVDTTVMPKAIAHPCGKNSARGGAPTASTARAGPGQGGRTAQPHAPHPHAKDQRPKTKDQRQEQAVCPARPRS